MPSFSDKVKFEEVTAIKETDQALLCEINENQVWIPKSQIDDDSEVFDAEDNCYGDLVVSQWIVEQKGLD